MKINNNPINKYKNNFPKDSRGLIILRRYLLKKYTGINDKIMINNIASAFSFNAVWFCIYKPRYGKIQIKV